MEETPGSVPPPRGEARAALIAAATSLVREFGLGGLAVDRVVERAGLSKGAFFHHFSTKRDMVAALLAHLALEFEADLAAREAGGEGFARALVHATLAEAERDTGFMAAMVESVALDRTLAPIVEARTELWTKRMIDEGMAEPDARLIRAALDGLLMQCLLSTGTPPDVSALRIALEKLLASAPTKPAGDG